MWLALTAVAVADKPIAIGTADVLKPAPVVVLSFPAAVFDHIKGPTAIFYFSPTCPHCQDVMPTVNALVGETAHEWLGMASSRATRLEIERFKTEYKPEFQILHDDLNAAFATAVSARSTPAIYIVYPREKSAIRADDPPNAVALRDGYAPFSRGMEGLFYLRSNLGSPFSHFDRYQGPRVCGSCHQVEHKSWVITHHAASYRTLYARDQATDTACVGCHVTGIDAPGGFTLADHASPMRDVTCEACHGPGGPHNPSTTKPVDPKSSCESCHDADHSINFSVAKGLPHIDHFVAADMSDEALKARIIAIGNGEAERPLLAFPDGPTAGSQACKSCHKSEHKKWSASPHAKAMKRLTGDKAAAETCVRCHATPKGFGLDSKTEGFHTDESVGCESCHGGGGAHIAAPSKENIVGLGSSCPECVIEAVCTSCHTPQWDPQWDLKSRLEAIKH
jgi:thiol-disulfide isomerase/thioredoxin